MPCPGVGASCWLLGCRPKFPAAGGNCWCVTLWASGVQRGWHGVTGVFNQTQPVSSKTAQKDFPFVMGLALFSEKIKVFLKCIWSSVILSLCSAVLKNIVWVLFCIAVCRIWIAPKWLKLLCLCPSYQQILWARSISMPKHLYYFSNLNSKWQVTRKVILLFCKAVNCTLCCSETQHEVLSCHWINPGY